MTIEKLKELLSLTNRHLAQTTTTQLLVSKESYIYYSKIVEPEKKKTPNANQNMPLSVTTQTAAATLPISPKTIPAYAKPPTIPRRQPIATPNQQEIPTTPHREAALEAIDKKIENDFSAIREIVVKRCPQIKIREQTPLPHELIKPKQLVKIAIYATPQNPQEQVFLDRVSQCIQIYGATPMLFKVTDALNRETPCIILSQIQRYLNDPNQKIALWNELKSHLNIQP